MPRSKKDTKNKVKKVSKDENLENETLSPDEEVDETESSDDIPQPKGKISSKKQVVDVVEEVDEPVVSEIKTADPLIDTDVNENEDSEELGLDDDEIDPFGDKWEE
jgi:hypothetical protein